MKEKVMTICARPR